MPRVKLTKTVIDALPTPPSDIVYWDAALPGFGVKVTPKGRKVFIVLYRTGGAGAKLRKYRSIPPGTDPYPEKSDRTAHQTTEEENDWDPAGGAPGGSPHGG